MGYRIDMKSITSIFEPFRPKLRPSFLIIGAQKAGTSALFSALSEHPKIIPPAKKELDFFSKDELFARGSRYYMDQFPGKPWLGQNQITFEASPSYLDAKDAPRRINDLLPKVKIIIILRDPVRRAFSAWNMFRLFKDDPNHGHLYDPRSFDDAVNDELQKKVDDARRYIARGIYADNVKRYLETFEQQRVLILPYPLYLNAPDKMLAKICEFLGLDEFEAKSSASTITANKRPYDHSMNPEMKEFLYRHYTPHMHDLFDLIGNTAHICEEDAYSYLWS